MFSMLLSSYRHTLESLGELEKTMETLTYGLCSHITSRSSKLPLVFLQLNRVCARDIIKFSNPN